jgi:hypothetical protein
MVDHKENGMTEQTMVPRLLDTDKACSLLHSKPMSWGLFEDAAKIDSDMALLLPAWKEFVEAQAKLDDVIAVLSIKHAAELTLK